MKYLKQRRAVFAVFAAFLLIFTSSLLLYRLPLAAVLYPTLLCVAVGAVLVTADAIRLRKKHLALLRIRTLADVVSDTLPSDNDIIRNDLCNIIALIADEHSAYRQRSEHSYAETAGYYTVWAHQIKTPIASMRLQLQNEDSALSRRLSVELYRIEQYVEMVLTFIRLGSESTDYVFKEYELDGIVKQAIKKFSCEFIDRRLSLYYEPLNARLVTDEKWLSFVIEQVLSNALKYTPHGSITVSMANEHTLRISDTGIGIAAEDLPRIFENGYTGYNGRTDKRASGIGLYLCKRVCDRLGLSVTVSSVLGVGTDVDIDISQKKLETE